MRQVLLVASIIAACVVTLDVVQAESLGESPAFARMKKAIADIVPLPEGSVLLRNEVGGLFETLDSGRTWSQVGPRVRHLAVSGGDKLWAFYGWPGRHESPSAALSFSSDHGKTWKETKFHVPDSNSEMMYASLPAIFLNAPTDAPMLLMYNLQILRPEPGKEPDSWARIGVPIPAETRSHGQWFGGGVASRGVFYVAYQSQIFMSNDGGRSWLSHSPHRFADGHIKCGRETCFALLSALGSEWSEIFSTNLGKNAWKDLGALSIDKVKRALEPIARGRSPVERFGATDLLVTEQGIFVSVIVNAGTDSWGAVLLVQPGAEMKAVGTAVDNGLWRLERDTRGAIWAGGLGAFQLREGRWQSVWSGE